MSKVDYSRFADITFDDFCARAKDDSLSRNEKIGFHESHREGFEEAIFAHLCRRLPALSEHRKTILDIGCGCSKLADLLIDQAERQEHMLLMADSGEMLAHLPERSFMEKLPGRFPENSEAFTRYKEKIDAILVYSVTQHIILDGSLYRFIDEALALLAPGGAMLIGDIPNVSKRDRFLSSPQGVAYHRRLMGDESLPDVHPLSLKPNKIDDGVIFGILQRYRHFGFETYLLPQPDSLPMHNRREDVLIVKW